MKTVTEPERKTPVSREMDVIVAGGNGRHRGGQAPGHLPAPRRSKP